MSMPPNRSLFHHHQGNFDFPPANDPDSAIGDLTVRFDHLRRHLQMERDEFNRLRDAAATMRARIRQGPSPMPSRSLRRTASFRNMRSNESSESDRPSSLPPPLMPSNRGNTMSLSRARRRLGGLRRLREEQREQLERTDQHLQDRLHRLEQLSSELHDHTRTLQASDPDYVRRRAFKRVKRDHPGPEAAPAGFHNFRYGKRGQLLPGNLKMEIASCDGGHYHSPPGSSPMHDAARPYPYENQSRTFLPENVLTDDNSVYCTSRGRCNLMLRHVGESSFTLDRLMIKAPVTGFTAPVQQGLVFVGYDQDELLQRTEAYHINYPTSRAEQPPSRQTAAATRLPDNIDRAAPQSRTARDTEQLSLLESLHDERMWREHQSRERERYREQMEDWRRHAHVAQELTHYFSNHDAQTIPRTWNAEEETTDEPTDPFDDISLDTCDWPPLDPIRAFTPSHVGSSDLANSGRNVHGREGRGRAELTDYSQTDRSSSAPYPSFYYPAPLAEAWEHPSDDDGAETETLRRGTDSGRRDPVADYLIRHSLRSSMASRRIVPGTIEPCPDMDSVFATTSDTTGPHASHPTDKQSSESHHDLLRPNSRFFIGKDQDWIAIKFDPPVSGRFILLKLFSPVDAPDGGNIDVQYVGAYGFAGPRFFPSLEYSKGTGMPGLSFGSGGEDEDALGRDSLF